MLIVYRAGSPVATPSPRIGFPTLISRKRVLPSVAQNPARHLFGNLSVLKTSILLRERQQCAAPRPNAACQLIRQRGPLKSF